MKHSNQYVKITDKDLLNSLPTNENGDPIFEVKSVSKLFVVVRSKEGEEIAANRYSFEMVGFTEFEVGKTYQVNLKEDKTESKGNKSPMDSSMFKDEI